jgi:hypothetical protein
MSDPSFSHSRAIERQESNVQDLNIKKTYDKILSVEHWEFMIFVANPILILTTPYLTLNSCSFFIKFVNWLEKKCKSSGLRKTTIEQSSTIHKSLFANISMISDSTNNNSENNNLCWKNWEAKMWYVQLTLYILVSCGFCYIIYLSGAILINPKEDERFRLITLMIIFLILYIFEFNLKIWYRNEELRRLIQECYFVTNLKIRSVENFKKNWWGLFSLYWVFLLSHIIGFCLTADVVRKNDPLISSRYQYLIWLPLYMILTFSVMFYICLCWMIFSRFKNLNLTIIEYITSQKNDGMNNVRVENKKVECSTKQATEVDSTKVRSENSTIIEVLPEGEQSSKAENPEGNNEDIEQLYAFIKWFNINIRQMIYFNQVFSLSMSNFFFVHSCGLMIAVEDLIYKYEKQSLSLIICNIFFNVHRIAIFVYIVKQTVDITREASKTYRYVNEFCQMKYTEENNEEFKKEVNKLQIYFLIIFSSLNLSLFIFKSRLILKISNLNVLVNFKLLGIVIVDKTFLFWFLAITYSTFIVFHNFHPFDLLHRKDEVSVSNMNLSSSLNASSNISYYLI